MARLLGLLLWDTTFGTSFVLLPLPVTALLARLCRCLHLPLSHYPPMQLVDTLYCLAGNWHCLLPCKPRLA